MKKLKVGIYGQNGHQIWDFLEGYDRVEFVASAKVTPDNLDRFEAYKMGRLKIFDTLDDMLAGCELDLICLCSPIRHEQVEDAIKVLKSDVSVYAEKPCAFSEAELDRILEAAKTSKGEFHDIADSSFTEPYATLKKIVESGKIGEVAQIYVQKSYPQYFQSRPSDIEIDGGLTRQVGIHAARFIEHCCGVKIKEVKTFETSFGAPEEKKEADFATASSIIMTLSNGGVASMCLNYFRPKGFKTWGNESIRVFGTCGMAEITDGGQRTRLFTENGDEGEFVIENSPKPFFKMLCEHLLDGAPMPFSLEEELSPVRAIIRMKEASNIQ